MGTVVTTQQKEQDAKQRPATSSVVESLASLLPKTGATAGIPSFLGGMAGRASVQTKRMVDQAQDPYERQADRVAEGVKHQSRAPSAEATRPTPMPSRQRPLTAPPDMAGSPLPRTVQERLEPALGVELSRVRVHTDTAAHTAAHTLQAKAFTHQNHIWLGAHESPDNAELMAHEATHVVQQDAAIPAASTSAPAIQRQAEPAASGTSPPASAPGAAASASPTADALPDVAPEDTAPLDETAAAATEEASGEAEQGESTETTEEAEAAEEAEVAEEGEEGEEGGDGGDAAADGSGSGDMGGADAGGMMAESGAGALATATGDLALVDAELAEHQRWGSAMERVGTAESLEQAEFVAEAAGGGLLGGLASGAAMGLGMGLVGRAATRFIPIPGVGGVLSGAMSVYGLATRDWSASGETIGKFGEGASTYETLANSIASIAEIVDIVSNVLGFLEGVVGVIQIGIYAATGAAGIATVLTLGAAAPILAALASLAETLTAISLGLATATTALDLINSAILQPAVLLFRALHAFTSQADPREVESQGSELAQAAGTIGGAIGAAVGARGAAVGSGTPRPTAGDAPHNTPLADPPVAAAAGDGPTVRFETPSSVDAPTARSSETPALATTDAGSTRPASVVATPAGRSEPPSDPYDVAAWERYYADNPGVGRSVSSASSDDPGVRGETVTVTEITPNRPATETESGTDQSLMDELLDQMAVEHGHPPTETGGTPSRPATETESGTSPAPHGRTARRIYGTTRALRRDSHVEHPVWTARRLRAAPRSE